MLRPRIASVVAFCVVSSIGAAAFADPPSRADMIHALSGFERGPDVATMQAWGTSSVPSLIDIARDTTITGPARLRAVYGLRAFSGDTSARAFLRTVALDTQNLLVMRRAAFDALAEGFADVELLTRVLADQDAAVRDGAAWAMSRIHTVTARTALESALRRETSDTVRVTLRSALQTR